MLGVNDIAVFHWINSTIANPLFDIVMPILTKMGSGNFLFIAAVFIILLSGPEKRMAGILLLAGLTAGYFAVDFIKDSVALPRPFMSMPDVRLLAGRPDSFSFPSGHAFDAFMAAVVMTRFFKKEWLWYTLAILAGFSRIYVGAHYPSDVLSGALFGIIIGYILVRASERSKVG